jgi:hypothetical protein
LLGETHNLGIKERYKALMMMGEAVGINYNSNSGTLTSSRNLFNNQGDVRMIDDAKNLGGVDLNNP